jgi:hypothetical protein
MPSYCFLLSLIFCLVLVVEFHKASSCHVTQKLRKNKKCIEVLSTTHLTWGKHDMPTTPTYMPLYMHTNTHKNILNTSALKSFKLLIGFGFTSSTHWEKSNLLNYLKVILRLGCHWSTASLLLNLCWLMLCRHCTVRKIESITSRFSSPSVSSYALSSNAHTQHATVASHWDRVRPKLCEM